MITSKFIEDSSLPVLSWCAQFEKQSNALTIRHGSGVDVIGNGFVEGAWDGQFSDFDFIDSSVMCGTGGTVSSDEARFIASTHRLNPIVSIEKAGVIYLSNSIMFVLTAAGEDLDPIYPYYPYDLIKIWRQGDHCPAGEVPLSSQNKLRFHFGALITIQSGGDIQYDFPYAGEEPSDYQEYHATLSQKVKQVVANAQDPARKIQFEPIAALTQGYDSSATCILAKEAGCEDTFCIADSLLSNPSLDTGEENAQRLGMNYSEVDRWDFNSLPYERTAELSLFSLSSYAPVAAAEELLNNRLFITGHRGDLVWDIGKIQAHKNLEHTWARFLSGVNMMEYRLRVGFCILSPATILERHTEAIDRISRSDEMKPWSVDNRYNRPIARRIIEEGGLPRGTFAGKKIGTGHYNFRYSKKDTTPFMIHYGEFLKQSHANVPWTKRAYWKARHWIDDIHWRKLSSDKAKHIRSTPQQRRSPFVYNVSPLKARWHSSFTLQWAFSILKDRYSFNPSSQDE
ncbi:hypothetical protein NT6N_28750 [Oceaniferula spumae]|uniref:Asparagine synthetase domain-containing protein n=1 Tax=Oceaniferula spumae TaxID=2979115 RepID=A0AAT9FPF2_9BACT